MYRTPTNISSAVFPGAITPVVALFFTRHLGGFPMRGDARQPYFHLGFRVDPELDARLAAQVKFEHRNRSAIIREALWYYLARAEQSAPAQEYRQSPEVKVV